MLFKGEFHRIKRGNFTALKALMNCDKTTYKPFYQEFKCN